MKKINLRVLNDDDVPLLTKWLNQDYIKKWYLEPENWLTEIRGRHSDYSWIHHFIIISDGMPIGFCQYYDCYDARSLEEWHTINKSSDTFSIDYLIGNVDYLAKGYGSLIVKFLIEKIKVEEKANKIIVQSDKENIPSNNALIANNFVFDSQKDYYYKILKR